MEKLLSSSSILPSAVSFPITHNLLAPVVQTSDSAIHRINRYPTFEQPEPVHLLTGYFTR